MSAAVTTRNPASGTPLAEYAMLSDEALDARLADAAAAFEAHRRTPFAERAAAMRAVADALEGRQEDLAALMTREMGKPIGQARAEVAKCAWVCRYYAERAAGMLADEPRRTEARSSLVAYEPLGPVLAVMPWNFPLWQVFRFAAPSLMAGNVGLLKHAENVQGCARAIEALFREGGFGEGVFQNVLVSHDQAAVAIADDRVAAVTLTGSERAGRAVGKAAGAALKPSLLELGGSDAFIVLDDADLDRAVEVGVQARMQNNGQSCIAAKRFILHEAIADAFTERFVEAVEALRVGDPMNEDTDLGPLAREDLRETLHEQVQRTVEQGATLLTGGEALEREGYYYAPTVLAGVTAAMLPFEEELFGPAAALVTTADADEAVALANATPFGLGGAVFTGDRHRGEAIARRMRSGAAFVNEMTKSHPNLPFGGIGRSGYGRELGRPGILAFVNAKTIWVD